VFEAHRLLNHSTQCSRVIRKKRSTRIRCQTNNVAVPQKFITNKLSVHAHTGRGAGRAEGAHGTPTQSHISPSIFWYMKINIRR